MRKPSIVARLAIIGAVLAIIAGACSGDDASSETTAATSAPAAETTAPAAAGSGLTIAMITHEVPGDTYWDIIRAGAEQGAQQHGIDLKYSADPDFTRQAVLVQNAIDSGVDGIALTAAGPAALKDAVAAAAAAGIPLVMFDSGIEDWKDMGALMYFGSDEYIAGQALGQYIADSGGSNVLCVIHQEGSTALEARCRGVGERVSSENMQVQGTDDASVNASITAKLQQDPSIDWVVTMGAPIALVALDSIETAGSSAKVGTFDLNVVAAEAIRDGDIEVAIDAQPYLQGYLAVDSLWLLNTNGNDIGGGYPVLTGPSIVDSGNIDSILPFSARGTR